MLIHKLPAAAAATLKRKGASVRIFMKALVLILRVSAMCPGATVYERAICTVALTLVK